jgi:hypothetical protein
LQARDPSFIKLVQHSEPLGTSLAGGIGEWSGPWSDGSKEWTRYWMKKLNHCFGNEGEFWMSYN